MKGDNFQAIFNLQTGAIQQLKYGERNIFLEGNGPQLDAYRAPTDNDAGMGYPSAWFQNGLYDMQHTVKDWSYTAKKDGTYQLNFTVESQGKEGLTRSIATVTVTLSRRIASVRTNEH